MINLGLPVLIIAMPFCRFLDSNDGYSGKFSNSYYVENASFLRLKNVVLGYTLPKSVLSKDGYPKLTFVCTSREFADWIPVTLDWIREYTNADMGKESGGDLQRGVDMGGWPSTMRSCSV